jgi:hypothetical protein
MLQVLSKLAEVHYKVCAVPTNVPAFDVINQDRVREDYYPKGWMIVNMETGNYFI